MRPSSRFFKSFANTSISTSTVLCTFIFFCSGCFTRRCPGLAPQLRRKPRTSRQETQPFRTGRTELTSAKIGSEKHNPSRVNIVSLHVIESKAAANYKHHGSNAVLHKMKPFQIILPTQLRHDCVESSATKPASSGSWKMAPHLHEHVVRYHLDLCCSSVPAACGTKMPKARYI